MTRIEKRTARRAKLKEFWEDNKSKLPGILLGVAGIGVIGVLHHQTNKAISASNWTDLEADDVDTKWLSKGWDEETMRPSWDKVHNLAKDLTLTEGESYVIEDHKQYGDEFNADGPIVSHLVYDSGVYPLPE